LSTASEADRELVGVADDVVVGEDVALLADDDSGAEAELAELLLAASERAPEEVAPREPDAVVRGDVNDGGLDSLGRVLEGVREAPRVADVLGDLGVEPVGRLGVQGGLR
jgi:hypothetical protein